MFYENDKKKELIEVNKKLTEELNEQKKLNKKLEDIIDVQEKLIDGYSKRKNKYEKVIFNRTMLMQKKMIKNNLPKITFEEEKNKYVDEDNDEEFEI